MIATKDRSLWIGASDSDKVVGNWETKTWKRWWLEKMGLLETSSYASRQMNAGTHYEHAILRSLGLPLTLDHQIKIPELRVRVNYDGIILKDKDIYECKTYNYEKKFKVSKTYWRQAQFEMFAAETDKLHIVAYGLTEKEYKYFFCDIDESRRMLIPVERDDEFIDGLLVPRLKILSKCLNDGSWPRLEETNENTGY